MAVRGTGGLPACVLAAAFMAWASAASAQRQESHDIPLVAAAVGDRHLLVDVRLTDTVAGTFLVDTGAAQSMVTDEIAQRLGLRPQPLLRDGVALRYGDKPAMFIRLAAPRIGPMPVGDTWLCVVPASTLRLLSYTGPPIVGILGTDLLSQFTILLDTERRRLRLWYPPGLSDEALQRMGFARSFGVAMETDNWLRPSVPVRFGDSVTESLCVDTGASTTMVTPAVARRLGLAPVVRGVREAWLGGPLSVDVAHVPGLSVGVLSVAHQAVRWPAREVPGLGSLLGLDVLTRFRVLLDYKTRRAYFGPGPDRVGVGLEFASPKDGSLVISTVVPGSSAEREGLQEGDEVLALARTRIAEMPGFLYELVLDKPLGSEIAIAVRRRGKDLPEFRLKVERLP